jgi:prefoldin subunit 5
MEGDRLYQRVEALERTQERHSALLQELQRRMDGIEEMREDMRRMEQSIARLEGQLEQMLIRIEEQLLAASFSKIIMWALLMLILGGIVAAGFELFRK